jgi:hypothetical protein
MKGLADRYPGDRRIATDPRVLFSEDFDVESVAALERRWSNVRNPVGRTMALSDDAVPGAASRHSLQITATVGVDEGGHLYQKLTRGVDRLHARFYVKFPRDADYVHHFVAMGGYNPPTPWPQGGAGQRPRGDDRLSVEVGPHSDEGKLPAPGCWGFYNYWHEMKPDGHGDYWGNIITPSPRPVVPRGCWQCIEMMVGLNATPEGSDGSLALWLDGKRAHQATGFRWRKSLDLRLNFFWLQNYVTEGLFQRIGKRPHPVNRAWFGNIVLATEYIGPLRKG